MAPRRGIDADDAAALHSDAGDLGLLMDLHAAPVGAAAVAPGHGVMARDRARLVEQRAQDGRMAAASHVDRWECRA